MKRFLRKMATGAAAVAMLVSVLTACPVQAYEHGTTDQVIKLSDCNNTPDPDYKINEAMQADAKDGIYDQYFLKDDLQTVKITVDENNLNYLLQNAADKPSVMTKEVTIGDQSIGYVGLKTKGSYTLEHTVDQNFGSDRFSFSLNFGKYIKKAEYGHKQNFFGCDKISFNNFFFDRTMMKEYVCLQLMTEMGLPTPQYGLAKLYINDQYYGVYFMVENLDPSILEQYLQVDGKEVSDYLVKPEETTLLYDEAMDAYQKEDGTFDLSSVLKQDSKGVYTASDEISSQSPLWENDADTLQDVATMLPTVFSWQKKINQLSEAKDFSGKDIDANSDEYLKLLEQVMDVDETVKYFAVHSFLVQLDDMFVGQKNYGLYVDTNGKCMVIPWDYDLSFGCYYPSDAESTANYDIDVMYRQNLWGGFGGGFGGGGPGGDDRGPQENENQDTKKSDKPDGSEIYEEYPLFQVIFQNDSLMEKYHQYMKDCAKVATLGGTTSLGKTYDPGLLNSSIAKLKEKLQAAASETLADNVRYLNGQNQPGDLTKGLPNLSSIIALRSVGVLTQVDGVETTVSGQGCNLETLGNAVLGENSNSGNLTIVDSTTGIYASADYGTQSYGAQSPSLTIRQLETTETTYENIKKELHCSDKKLTVYNGSNPASPVGKYTLNIPVSQDVLKQGATVYVYTTQGLEKLDTTLNDNVYTAQTDTIQYIVIQKGGSSLLGWLCQPVIYIVAGGVVLAAVGIWVFIRFHWKKKRKKTENAHE